MGKAFATMKMVQSMKANGFMIITMEKAYTRVPLGKFNMETGN